MSLLRVLPIAAVVGVATVALGKAIADYFDEEETPKTHKMTNDDIKAKISQYQNELARLHDLKILNDKRESTGQVKKTTITVGGVEIDEAISVLEADMERLVTKLNKRRNRN